jgi:paraquat-inducible protein B
MSDQIPTTTPDSDIPEAVVARRSRLLPELVWAIPIVAALIGGWLAVKAIRSHGPTITITFRDAAGLAAGKTKIKYRDVDVGEVRSIGFSPDRVTVVVTAELMREAASWMVDDTRFWVVRPRIAASEISGLETLLSGSYIGLDVGTSALPRRDFRGLETVPVISGGTPGRAFVAHAARSIGVGSPVIFRHLQVGQVTASDLDADGNRVSVGIFVRAPYDRYVTTATRFWEASGVDISLTTGGLKIETESLVTLIVGGICFEPGPDGRDAGPAPPNQAFVLFRNRDAAMKQPDTEAEDYTLVFRQSVRGLEVGAPVDFRGVPLGEVTRIGADYDPVRLDFTTPVDVRIYPGRLRARLRHEVPAESPASTEARLQRLVDHGLRAQLRSDSFLTGRLYVALDFYPLAPRIRRDLGRHPREIPTLPVDDLGASLAGAARKIDRLPLDQVGPIIGDFRQVLAEAVTVFADADSAVKQFGPTSPRQAELDEVFQQITRAARSLRALADSLERHPESLIRGRKGGSR